MRKLDDKSQAGSRKKVKFTNDAKFNDGNPNPKLFMDEDEDEDLETWKRRGQVKQDVYQSDEEVSNSDLSDVDEKDKDNDEDMFNEGSKKPNVMSLNDVEGQEGDIEEEHFESFNMKKEFEEGEFTQSGAYTKKVDEHQVHDSWLKGINKKDIQLAREAHEIQQSRLQAADDRLESNPDKLTRSIVSFLNPGETVTQAIKRLGLSSQKVPKWKKPKKGAQTYTPEQVEKDKKDLEILSSLVTDIFTHNQDIYETRYEQMVVDLQKKGLIPLDWVPGTSL